MPSEQTITLKLTDVEASQVLDALVMFKRDHPITGLVFVGVISDLQAMGVKGVQ